MTSPRLALDPAESESPKIISLVKVPVLPVLLYSGVSAGLEYHKDSINFHIRSWNVIVAHRR